VSSEVEKKVTTLSDANKVAFLILRGFIAIPFIQTEKGGDERESKGSTVAWDVEAEDGKVDAELKAFNANVKVGVREFVRILKDVRGEMYSVKQANNQLKGR
jgi:hypothetical protein